jgi:hypothetical protein
LISGCCIAFCCRSKTFAEYADISAGPDIANCPHFQQVAMLCSAGASDLPPCASSTLGSGLLVHESVTRSSSSPSEIVLLTECVATY